jgi:hypothetical protein
MVVLERRELCFRRMLQRRMDDHDTQWKRAIRHLFFDFLAMCWPNACKRVDRTIAPEFLEQELPQMTRHARRGKRQADLVVRVASTEPRSPMILHIEIQHCRDRQFGERMQLYHFRLDEKYACPVHSLAILADDSPTWRPCCGTVLQLDGQLVYSFPTFKAADYRDSIDKLLAGDNAFGFFVAVHLLTRKTRRSPGQRLKWKCKVIERLYEHGNWPERTIADLLSLIDWQMELPRELQEQCDDLTRSTERSHNMELMPRFAHKAMKEGKRIGFILGWEEGREEGREAGRKEGREEGREEGRKEGLGEGRLQGQRDLLLDQLAAQFGPLSGDICEKIALAEEPVLQRWARAVCKASCLSEVIK